jgi:Protein of unknown function (DUF1569)
MAQTIWNATDRQAILYRFGRLSPGSRPKWGSLDAPRMVTHATDAVRASLGEVKLAPLSGPLHYWPINVVVMFYLPWPRSAPTAPELLERKPVSWTSELETLESAVSRFVAGDVNGSWTPHVAFGALTGAQWGRLHYRHLDHHLGQFGV